jgi:prepilin-type N-terminal cleavage/methylation domain-containing protein
MRRSGGQAVRRTGTTLVELLVVLALLGLVFGISGLALGSLQEPRESPWIRELRRARTEAIRSGKPVRLMVSLTARPPDRPTVLFLPDGRAVGPGVDPLTGAPVDSAR